MYLCMFACVTCVNQWSHEMVCKQFAGLVDVGKYGYYTYACVHIYISETIVAIYRHNCRRQIEAGLAPAIVGRTYKQDLQDL